MNLISFFSNNFDALITVLVLFLSLILFIKNTIAPELTGLLCVGIFIVTGVLTPEKALSGFGSPSLITLMGLFAVSSALFKSGALDRVRELISSENIRTPRRLILLITFLIAPISGIVPNTPVVASLLPLIEGWCERRNISPSKVLLPLSFATLLGGTLTLLGSSVNLLVSDISQQLGYGALELFSLTSIGIPVWLIGTIYMILVSDILLPDRDVNQVVPTNGFTMLLTFSTSAAMAFLIVFSLAMSFAADRLAQNWSDSLANSATLRVSAPLADLESQTEAALNVLSNTKGIESFRLLKVEEQQALLEPWFGPKVPISNLPMPRLISIEEDKNGYDRVGLRLRLAAEVPSAVLDDHTRWREPLVKAAYRIRFLGWLTIGLVFFIIISMMSLVTRAALSSNKKVIEVLRLVGATDQYIAAAFVRKFAFRAFFGSLLGAFGASMTLFLLPSEADQTVILAGLRLEGFEWSWLIVVPLSFFVFTFLTARIASLSILRSLT